MSTLNADTLNKSQDNRPLSAVLTEREQIALEIAKERQDYEQKVAKRLERAAELDKQEHDRLVQERIPLKEEYDKQVGLRNAANAEIARVGALIEGIDKRLGPIKTVCQGEPTTTVQRAALSPIKSAIVKIRRTDCKLRTVNGVPFFVLKEDPNMVVDLENQTLTPIS